MTRSFRLSEIIIVKPKEIVEEIVEDTDMKVPEPQVYITLLVLLLVQIGYFVSFFYFTNELDKDAQLLFFTANLIRFAFACFCFEKYGLPQPLIKTPEEERYLETCLLLCPSIYLPLSIAISVEYWLREMYIGYSKIFYIEIIFNTYYPLLLAAFLVIRNVEKERHRFLMKERNVEKRSRE